MIINEFLPLLAAEGLDIGRLALLGWSMGGFGALHLASLLGPGRVSAVGAMSAALWTEYAAATPVAFDSAEDFSRDTPLGKQAALDGIPVRIDCGRGDEFIGANHVYVSGFDAAPAGDFELGDHDLGYWRRVFAPQLTFAARALAQPNT